MKNRCWENISTLMEEYHDLEWGTPSHDDQKLFEFLILDGMQVNVNVTCQQARIAWVRCQLL